MAHLDSTLKHYNEHINMVLHYIQTHLGEKADLAELASISAISPYHFHRIMRAHLGESLMSYIIRIRMDTSASLLLYTDMKITDIAWQMGYDVPSSFNKAFKKRFGRTPSEFRNGYDQIKPINTFKRKKR